MAYEAQARAAGDARFLGEQGALTTQQQIAANRAAADQAALQQWGQTGSQAINTSFDQLLADMGANRKSAMDVIGAQTHNVGVGYDQTAQGNQAVRDESRNYIQRLMGNLGLGNDVVADVQRPMEELTNQLVGRNTQYGQDARTNLGNWGAQHNVLYGDQEVNARGAQAFQQGAFQGQVGNLLSKSQLAASEKEREFASALQALMGQRGGFEVEYAQDLADKDSARNLQMAEMQAAAARAQAELEARAQEFQISQVARLNEQNVNQGRWQAELGLDTRKQDFAEWMALNEGGEQANPWDSGGVLGMRQYAEQTGSPGLFDQADQYLNRASQDPRVIANPGSLRQVASQNVRQPVAQYGRIGGGSGQPGMWERPRNYEDIINAIAIGSR